MRSGSRNGRSDLLAARDVARERLLAILQQHDAPDDVLELAHITAPRMLQKSGCHLRRECPVSSVLLIESREEPRRQDEDLLFAISQRGNADLHHVQAVVEVFPEVASHEPLLEVAIGGGDDPDIDIDRAVSPDTGKAEVLQDVQEFGLQRKGKIGDLVEIDRSLVGILELARLATVRSGERALFVTGQL